MVTNALVLLGWKGREEGIALLRKHCAFEPSLTELEAEALWLDYRDRVERLAGRSVSPPQELPLTGEEQSGVDEFLAYWDGRPYTPRSVIKIDPSALVVHQLEIVIDRSRSMASQSSTRRQWVARFLLTEGTNVQPVVRHAPNAIDIELPHGEWRLLFDPHTGFRLNEGSRYVNVSSVGGRPLLWAGYHRTYASMAYGDSGDRTIIAVVTGDATAQVGAGELTSGRRAAESDNPPLFGDYFDPRLAARVPLRAKRFEMQIRARVVAKDLVNQFPGLGNLDGPR